MARRAHKATARLTSIIAQLFPGSGNYARRFGLALALAALQLTEFAPSAAAARQEKLIVPYEIDDELAAWARRIAPPEQSPLRRLRALSQALLDPRQLGLREVLDRTPTANQAFHRRQANCVGFASLFVGMAREVGVPVFFVVIDDLGRRQLRGDLRITEGHLAAAWGPPERLRIFDFAGESDGENYRSMAVTDLTAIALYYSNRGVETMLEDRNAEAARWLSRAVDLDPSLAAARINLGVALRRLGDLDGAEASYHEALRIDPGAGAAAHSLAALLRLRGRSLEAETLLADAQRLAGSDALSYLNLARRSLATGDFEEARGLYRKALELSRQKPR